jgi:molecular chaperone DnaK
MAPDNKSLGKFILDGIPPAPRGVPQIEVTFDIDADGILHVSATDKATGRAQSITITASSGLEDSEIERMVGEAERHRQEDQERRELVETRNKADSLVYQAEKVLREHGERIPGDVKAELQDRIAAVQTALDSPDLDTIRRAADDLSQVLQRAGESMYKQPGAQAPSDEAPGDQEYGEEDVVDGENSEA